MEKKNILGKNSVNLLSRFSTVFYMFLFFTLPRLISKEPISFDFTSCFYTNGLFDKTGISFVKAFMFELPIAVARWIGKTGMLPLLAVALILTVIDVLKHTNIEKHE